MHPFTVLTAVAAPLGKFNIFDFEFSLTKTYTFWAGVAGGCFLTTATHGTDQLMVQRLLAARDQSQSRKALFASWAVILVQFTLFLLIVYLNSNNLFFSPGLYLSKRSDKMWFPNLLQLVIRFVLYFALVPKYLLEGVIIASLVASLVSFVHNYYLSEKYFKLRPDFTGTAIQFLPFVATLVLTLIGTEIFNLGIWMRLLAMAIYLLILGSYFFLKHDENHPQPV